MFFNEITLYPNYFLVPLCIDKYLFLELALAMEKRLKTQT